MKLELPTLTKVHREPGEKIKPTIHLPASSKDALGVLDSLMSTPPFLSPGRDQAANQAEHRAGPAGLQTVSVSPVYLLHKLVRPWLFFFFFLWDWSLNSEHTSSPFFSDYFWRWGGGLQNYLPELVLNHNPPDLNLSSG
jgi:hypothetical protein